jgi:hypothetical protein
MNSPNSNRAQPDLLGELRRKLAEAERELLNPILFALTRKQLRRRAELLRLEISELRNPTPFREL